MNKNQEIALLENTLKLLRRGKYELTGEEALVFYSSFDYIIRRINELKKPEITPVVASAPLIKEESIKVPKKKKGE
jgi:hypothetical protein